ncbi:MAG: alpha/beta hydrolase [Bacteroidetes bacterium]|nr:alpha/beta hydrolase [Bacteroidota bacterium]
MKMLIKEEKDFKFIDEGKGQKLMLLHGLFGALSNYKDVLKYFSDKNNVIIPLLPLYDLPIINATIRGLVKHVNKFINYKGYKDLVLLGNSLGGHVALVYALTYPEDVKALVLTGSSGLYENTFGGSYPKKGNYEYIKEKTAFTFYDPKTASKELVDEVFESVNNRGKAIKIIAMSRSAMKDNLTDQLPNIKMPVQLIWGMQDKITPPEVAEDFHSLLPNSELTFIDKCGHAPMMELPGEFNVLVEKFLVKLQNDETSQ